MPYTAVDIKPVLRAPGTSPQPYTVPRVDIRAPTLGGAVGGSGEVRGGGLIVNGATYGRLYGVCSDCLGGSTWMPKTENCSGEGPEVIAVYRS